MSTSPKILDALLVLESQAGSKKAMALLVKRWHPKLCKQALWYVQDSDQAKDIAQDSWGVILKKIQFLKDPNKFGGWALKIVTRKALDYLRKQKKERNNIAHNYGQAHSTTTGDRVVDTENIISVVLLAIKELSGNQQIILDLFYLEEFSIQQISEILELAPGTVKSRLFTAREQLKTILKNRNYEK